MRRGFCVRRAHSGNIRQPVPRKTGNPITLANGTSRMSKYAQSSALNRLATQGTIEARARRRRVRYEYPEPFRETVLAASETASLRDLSREHQVPLSTLYRWRNAPADGSTRETSAPREAPSTRNDCAPRDGDALDSSNLDNLAADNAEALRRFSARVARMRESRRVLVRLTQAREVIEQSYFERIDCATLASVAGMSRCHFVRSYTQVFGESPHQHLLRKRVEAALDLLAVTLQPNAAIASAVGFESPSSLARAIRKFTRTPRQRSARDTDEADSRECDPNESPPGESDEMQQD